MSAPRGDFARPPTHGREAPECPSCGHPVSWHDDKGVCQDLDPCQPCGSASTTVHGREVDPGRVERGLAAVREMPADWWCPRDPTRQRIACPECIAEVALGAALAADTGEAQQAVEVDSTARRLAWFTSAELLSELNRRRALDGAE